MNAPDLLNRYFELFAARTDVYGVGKPKPTDPTKYAYFKVEGEYSPEVLRQHLAGQVQLGVYPIVDNKVRWFAIDFDAPKGKRTEADVFEAIWTEAVAQLEQFKEHGVTSYLERSRSGTGVHLWVFFDDWLPAVSVRRALKPLLLPSISFDRIYPVQDTVEQGSFGNLLALPYNQAAYRLGNSAFLDVETREQITPKDFLANVATVSLELIETLAARTPAPPPMPVAVEGERSVTVDMTFDGRPTTPLTGWLKVISPYGCKAMRHAWTHRRECPEPLWYAMIQQATCFENGREIAHAMSKDYAGYSPREVDEKYNHAMENPPVGCQYIHDNLPQFACAGCPRTAPYHLAKKTIIQTTQESESQMQRGGFKDFRKTIVKSDTFGNSGIPLGHARMDKTFIFRESEMTVVGAPPSMGKTALFVDSATRIARQGTPVLGFSGETGDLGMRSRIIANMAGIDSRALRGERIDAITDRRQQLSREEWQRVDEAIEALDGMPLFLDFASVDPDRILAAIERTHLLNGIPFDQRLLVEVDYLQHLSIPEGDNIESRTARASAEFKGITKITGNPLLIYSQLVRLAEGAQVPQLNWFRGSGRIEADADAALVITGERAQGAEVRRSLWLLKQREGDAGIRFDFTLSKPTCRWDEAVQDASHVTPFNLPSDA